MTKKFDNIARATLLNDLDVKDYEFDGLNIKDIVVRQVTVKEVRGVISLFHYSRTMPDSTRFVYGGFIGDRLIGVICFGMGTSKKQYTSILPDIEKGEYLELTRVWCLHNAPKNTESMIISKALKMLPPEIKLIISYADSSKGHCGIIYQATNWYYLGTGRANNKRLVDAEGHEHHVRLISLYKERHPELREYTSEQIMNMYGWKYADCGVKHRYVYLRGSKVEKKRMLKHFKDRIQDYPKCNKPDMLTDLDIIAENLGGLTNE